MGLVPTTTVCPVCLSRFEQPVREQGGGTRKIYCSAKCRSLDWVRGHGASRKASIIKYDSKPESKEKKYARQQKTKFSKYNITEDQFLHQLARQNGLCAGCSARIDRYSAVIDHCHTTNVVRGLLCRHCNWALGHVGDNKEVLYKLAAYLSYDLNKKSIYLIGSLRNKQIPEIAKTIRAAGFTVWDEWFSAGPEADDYFQEYHTNLGMDYKSALTSDVANHIFYFDKSRLELCDAGLLVYPAGRSGHLELGYMAGMGKPTCILLDKTPERYDIMPQFAQCVSTNIVDIIGFLQSKLL